MFSMPSNSFLSSSSVPCCAVPIFLGIALYDTIAVPLFLVELLRTTIPCLAYDFCVYLDAVVLLCVLEKCCYNLEAKFIYRLRILVFVTAHRHY